MKVARSGDVLNLSEIRELSALTSTVFRNQLQDTLAGPVREVFVDLGDTHYMDCRGLSALLSVRKEVAKANPGAAFHLQNPSGEVERLVRLAGLDNALLPTTHTRGAATSVKASCPEPPSLHPAAALPILLAASTAADIVTKTE